MFWIGLASGIFESLGKTCIATAVTIGLAGPASAITSLSGVQEFPMRVKCATMAWHTLLSAVEKK